MSGHDSPKQDEFSPSSGLKRRKHKSRKKHEGRHEEDHVKSASDIASKNDHPASSSHLESIPQSPSAVSSGATSPVPESPTQDVRSAASTTFGSAAAMSPSAASLPGGRQQETSLAARSTKSPGFTSSAGSGLRKAYHRPPVFYEITIVLVVAGVVSAAVVLYLLFFAAGTRNGFDMVTASKTVLGNYTDWAVAVGTSHCSRVARSIFDKHGSTAEAAVASILCACTVLVNRCGLGGAVIITYYNGNTKVAHSINGRQTCPSKLTADMLTSGRSTLVGPLSIGVPGFLRGLQALLRVSPSKMAWKDLVADAVSLAEKGFPVFEEMEKDIERSSASILANPAMKRLLTKGNGTLLKQGDLFVQKELAQTLKLIGEHTPTVFYEGELSKRLVADLKEEGSVITERDLASYTAPTVKPVSVDISGGYTFFAPPPPAGGTILGYMLGLISNFVTQDGVLDDNELNMHRVVESIKYGFGRRPELGDPAFVSGIHEVVARLSERGFIARQAEKFGNRTLLDPSAYGAAHEFRGRGSGQVVVMGPDGDAVAITASINSFFGSLIVSKSTGVVMNNAINDFDSDSWSNQYHLVRSDQNRMAPGKRPLSNMAPTVIVDADGFPAVVASGIGGSRITSGLAQTIMRVLWMKANVKRAIDAGRLHDQLFPNIVYAEETVPNAVLEGLRNRGHQVSVTTSPWNNNIVMVHHGLDGRLYAAYDFRKESDGGTDGGNNTMPTALRRRQRAASGACKDGCS